VQVIPAVDVLGGAVVRLRRGDFDDSSVYGDDPASAVRRFGRSGADLVHVVDLEGARTGRSGRDLWHRVGAAGVPFQAAGGLRSTAAALEAVEAGAVRVVVGTAAVWAPEVLAEIIDALGEQRVVAAVDVREGRARGAGWTDEGLPLGEVVGAALEAGVVRLMVTAVSRDGTMAGPDLGLLRRVLGAVHVPVIAAGGITSTVDVRALAALGVEAVVIGRALYEGKLTLAAALEAAQVR
jgi:phosphoribosylformimino-5-aminoimidazole carboxamide ribotide isomerase